jgi:hypothetical protein
MEIGCPPNWECRDINFSCANQVDLSAADKANGVEQQWCVDLTFVRRSANPAGWLKSNPEGWVDERSVYPYIIQLVNGTWEKTLKQCSCGQ